MSNVLFRLSQEVFADFEDVKYFFTNSLPKRDDNYFYNSMRLHKVEKEENIYFIYNNNIVAKTKFLGEIKNDEKRDEKFTVGHKIEVVNVYDEGFYINRNSLDNSTSRSIAYLDKNDTDRIEAVLGNRPIGNLTMKNTIKKYPLNQILFGSPGTGKTYNTINKALLIIDGEVPKNRKEAKRRFEELRNSGQIEFVTFHQSYGYEEFVEGIKADVDSENIAYSIESGIFKNLSDQALSNFEASQKASDQTLDIDLLLNDFANDIENRIENDGDFFFRENATIAEISRDSKGGFKSFSTGGSVKHQSLTKSIIKRDFEEFIKGNIKSFKDIKPSFESQSTYHGNAIYYFPLYEKIKEFYEANKTIYKSDQTKLKNFVLIIDEINRGNISKIFGELITLIEDSKRIGKDEEIRVRLPYSNELFGVPQNLYIIGTMNTADRSIAPIDTALRRRFEFVEMSPKPSLISNDCDGINLQAMIEAINSRIEYLYDKDHTIGHAYLIGIETLEDLIMAFRNKIIPLLAEYFYEDWENIALVLNNNGFVVESKEEQQYLANIKHKINNKKIYRISDSDSWSADQFIKIYEQSNS